MQEDVNEAYETLFEAYFDLVRLDRSKLEKEIATSEKINLENYAEAGKLEFLTALKDAKTVYGKEEVTKGEIDAALAALAIARANLRYKADKDILESLVKQAELIDLSLYTDESVALFRSALESAQMLLYNDNLPVDDQIVVDKSAAEMAKAIEGLQIKSYADIDKGSNSSNSGNSANTNNSNKTNAAKTGDESYVLALSTIALFLSLFVIYKKKKVNR